MSTEVAETNISNTPVTNTPATTKARGRPVSLSKDTLIQWGKDFKAQFGYFPSKDDCRGANKKAYEKVHGFKMVHASSVQRLFGSWSDYRLECGEVPSKYTHSDLAEDVSIAYLTKKYNFVEHKNTQGNVDGYINDKSVEVKASILRKGSRGTNRFRWSLHSREYSKLVDEMYLIGLTEEGEVLLEARLIPYDMERCIDNRAAIELSEEVLNTGRSDSYLWSCVIAYKPTK